MTLADSVEESSRLVSIDSNYICQCFKVTEEELLSRANASGITDFDQLRAFYKVGSRCTSCEVEIRDLLHEIEHERVALPRRSVRVPLFTRMRAKFEGLPPHGRYLARKVLRVPRRFGVFAVRDAGVQSEFVLSNLTFPDDRQNPNGSKVRFDLIVRNQNGEVVGDRRGLTIHSNESRVFTLDWLCPDLSGPLVGTVLANFYGLRETGALRPYCRLRYEMSSSTAAGSCHYHDQFTRRPHYQHVIVTHPLTGHEVCWVGLSNPLDVRYSSVVHWEIGTERFSSAISIPGNGAFWRSVPQLFGPQALEAARKTANSFVWLESDAPVMAWFFWQDSRYNAWSVQHK